ncbi:MAG: hypothetical protein AMXMBFR7_52860 [Planctomycetota bacterium]
MPRAEREFFATLLDALTRVESPAEGRLAIVREITRQTGSIWGHAIDVNGVRARRQFTDYAWGVMDDVTAISREHAHYTWKNPLWSHVDGLKGRVFQHAEVLGEKEWAGCEFHADFIDAHTGFKDLVGVGVRTAGPGFWLLVFAHQKMKYFKSRHRRLLRQVEPMVYRALANLDRWETRWNDLAAIWRISGEALAAIRVVRGAPTLEMSTPDAARILKLDLSPSGTNLALREFLRLGVRATGPLAGAVSWQAPDGRAYWLSSISPSEGLYFVRFESEGGSASSGDPALAAGARRAGLSAREVQVLALVARGSSDKQIATDLGLSYHTVRSHLRGIYSRLGVAGRIEAIHKLRLDAAGEPT